MNSVLFNLPCRIILLDGTGTMLMPTIRVKKKYCEMSGSHGRWYEDDSLLGYGDGGMSELPSPLSWPGWGLPSSPIGSLARFFLLIWLRFYCLMTGSHISTRLFTHGSLITLMMEAVCTSETSVYSYEITLPHITEGYNNFIITVQEKAI
jgi:hypothetical protein